LGRSSNARELKPGRIGKHSWRGFERFDRDDLTGKLELEVSYSLKLCRPTPHGIHADRDASLPGRHRSPQGRYPPRQLWVATHEPDVRPTFWRVRVLDDVKSEAFVERDVALRTGLEDHSGAARVLKSELD
jgi:hypothetical protein